MIQLQEEKYFIGHWLSHRVYHIILAKTWLEYLYYNAQMHTLSNTGGSFPCKLAVRLGSSLTQDDVITASICQLLTRINYRIDIILQSRSLSLTSCIVAVDVYKICKDVC